MAADDDTSSTHGWLWTLLMFLVIFGIVYYFFIRKAGATEAVAQGVQQGGSLGELLRQSGRTMRYH